MAKPVLLSIVMGLAACAAAPVASAPAAAGPNSCSHTPAAYRVAPQTVLGSVNGMAIHRSDLSPDANDALRDLDNEMLQRRFHLVWVGMEGAVDAKLLAAEATRRGMTLKALTQKEIDSKVEPPTAAQLKDFYDSNKQFISVPLKVAAPYLKQELIAHQQDELREALVAKLRQKADVRYSIPVPTLPRYKVAIDDAPVTGPKDAKVTLVEFADFQCPYCQKAYHVLKKLQQLYPHDLRIAYRDFPLQQHPRARPAAIAAQCARAQGKFWPYHDALFESAGALGDDDLNSYAQQLGLDMKAFSTCLTSDAPKKAVVANEQAGQRYGIEGTPAIFINGIKLIGLLPLPLMQAIIDHELHGS